MEFDVLSETEKTLIKQYRDKQKEKEEKIKKQATCVHDYHYVGHSHNDDCYQCRKCDNYYFE